MTVTQHNKTISIALCLCNPNEDFLQKQLESIENQTIQPTEIIVGDDSDNEIGLTVIRAWSDKTGIPCKIIQNKIRLGISQNFSRVLSQTVGNYIFLCDQDDVWFPAKIEESLRHIMENEDGGSTPVLFHTDLEIIDDGGSVIGTSFMDKQRIRGGDQNQLGLLMLHNNVTGCSAALNRSLLEQVLPIPQEAVVHDWWIALTAAITGKTVFGNIPLIQYRIHDANAIGLRPLLGKDNISRFLQPNHVGREFAKVVTQNYAIHDRYKNKLNEETINFMKQLQIGGFPLLRAAKLANVRPQAWSRGIRFKIAALSKTYMRFLST